MRNDKCNYKKICLYRRLVLDWSKIAVIGAGLAGSEAAWQIAQKGFKVKPYEIQQIN